MRPLIIHVEVSGPTASGKSTVMARIRAALAAEGYTVASPDLDQEMRLCRPGDLAAAPKPKAVVVLSETNHPREA